MAGIQWRRELCRQVGAVKDVVYAHRYASQQPLMALLRKLVGLSADTVWVESGERLHAGLMRFDPPQEMFGNPVAGRLTTAHRITDTAGIQLVERRIAVIGVCQEQ
ncbi:hypothetical protein D3C76_1611050 [compost metagenome]